MARPRCLAAILSVAITASLPSLGNAAVPENTISHGGVTVPLSGQFYCDWPKAAMTHQPPDCPTLSICPVGCRDRKLPLNTPGSVYVHLVVPMRFVAAGSTAVGSGRLRETKAVVRQLNAHDARVTYRHLDPGEVAWVSARYLGTVYRFFCLPVERPKRR